MNLNQLSMNYEKIEEKLILFQMNLEKPAPTSKRAALRGKVDLLEMILSHISKLFPSRQAAPVTNPPFFN